MLPAPLNIPVEAARRFHRRAVLLDAPVATIDAALAHHGYVQIDPINVCGRMQDHILRNRVTGYREGDLMRHLHGDRATHGAETRTAFEHHVPNTGVLVAFPFEAWPHLLGVMRRRTRARGAWSGKLTPRERELAERILGALAERGALSADKIGDKRRSRQFVWNTSSLAKSTLQKLFFHGRVLIARREHNRRVYDLPARILPASVLAQPEPDPDATARWLTLLKLRQRRLVTLKRDELPRVEDRVQPVQVPGCPVLYCLREDVPLFESASELSTLNSEPSNSGASAMLLAPLDPLIYDRVVTSRLWGFEYTWEVYTPPAKRARGYYALPVLAGTELVGHIDPRMDRERRKVTVVSRHVQRGHRVAAALRELGRFLHWP